jgi:hypothetical protein
VIFNDNFNGSNVFTNNGAGSVNPGSNETAFVDGSNNGDVSQNSSGAYFTPGNGYGEQAISSNTGNANGGSSYSLGATGTDFSFTVNDVSVSSDGDSSRADGTGQVVPGSGNSGFRFQLGVLSKSDNNNDAELYGNSAGGLYVNLFYDKEGNLTGDLRAVDQTHPSGTDNGGTQGIFELATFSIAQPVGTAAVTPSISARR